MPRRLDLRDVTMLFAKQDVCLARIPCRLDLRDIKVVCKPGGTIDDSSLVDGMVFDQKAAKTAGGPTKARAGSVCGAVRPRAAAGNA
jgi:chaperonin GroEL (HSP60 family)